MSNAIIRSDLRASALKARLAMLGCVTALLFLASQVPSLPGLISTVASTFSGEAPHLTLAGRLDRVLITAVGVLIWLLVLWIGLVVAIGLLARLIGGNNEWTLSVIRLLAPRAVRGMVIAALGVGAVAGLSGCAPGTAGSVVTPSVAQFTGGSSQHDLVWPSSAAVTPTPSSGTDSAGTTEPAAPGITIDLDWPTESATSTGPEQTTFAVPSMADPAPATASASADTGSITSPAGASVPTKPTPSQTVAPNAIVTVRPGDSLWTIAAAHLAPTATDAEIAAAWPRWYAVNSTLIGGNPDQIRPGWQLTIPTESGALQS
jgi:hypothetical protein